MADEPQISILDARLAEIDRRLRTIQTGLADDVGALPESEAGRPPKIAVPEPGGRAPRPVALAPPADAAPHADAAPAAPPADAAPPAAPAAPPAPARAEAASRDDHVPAEDPALVIAELRGLISDHARLLDAMGELLASGERLLASAHLPASPERRSPQPEPAAPPAGGPAHVTVTAGPFSSLEAVRDFERALGALPNVASVDVRGYEGEDRAMVDVRLSRPNP